MFHRLWKDGVNIGLRMLWLYCKLLTFVKFIVLKEILEDYGFFDKFHIVAKVATNFAIKWGWKVAKWIKIYSKGMKFDLNNDKLVIRKWVLVQI